MSFNDFLVENFLVSDPGCQPLKAAPPPEWLKHYITINIVLNLSRYALAYFPQLNEHG